MLLRSLSLAILIASPISAIADDHPVIAAAKAKIKDPDKSFVMLVKVKIKPGMNEKFTTLFGEAIKGTRKEVGNLAYDLNNDSEDGQTYIAYEKWKNLKALEEHLKAEYVTKLLAGLGDLAEGAPEIKFFTPAGE